MAQRCLKPPARGLPLHIAAAAGCCLLSAACGSYYPAWPAQEVLRRAMSLREARGSLGCPLCGSQEMHGQYAGAAGPISPEHLSGCQMQHDWRAFAPPEWLSG
jgi:hypothetical protein